MGPVCTQTKSRFAYDQQNVLGNLRKVALEVETDIYEAPLLPASPPQVQKKYYNLLENNFSNATSMHFVEFSPI